MDECKHCKDAEKRILRWIDHVGCTPRKYERYDKLLVFVKRLAVNTACYECDISHDAAMILREIGEYESI